MITLTITPQSGDDIYSLLTQKERTLRGGSTTFFRSGTKRKDRDKWVHARHKGWIQFQRCLGGVLVAEVKSRDPESTWALLAAFIGYVDRHFRASVTSINIQYTHLDD
jgi:hypothetical protein